MEGWWRGIWPGLEPWLAQLIWLDPRIASVFWSSGPALPENQAIGQPVTRARLRRRGLVSLG